MARAGEGDGRAEAGATSAQPHIDGTDRRNAGRHIGDAVIFASAPAPRADRLGCLRKLLAGPMPPA
jgi:hypothetical protein